MTNQGYDLEYLEDPIRLTIQTSAINLSQQLLRDFMNDSLLPDENWFNSETATLILMEFFCLGFHIADRLLFDFFGNIARSNILNNIGPMAVFTFSNFFKEKYKLPIEQYDLFALMQQRNIDYSQFDEIIERSNFHSVLGKFSTIISEHVNSKDNPIIRIKLISFGTKLFNNILESIQNRKIIR